MTEPLDNNRELRTHIPQGNQACTPQGGKACMPKQRPGAAKERPEKHYWGKGVCL